MMLKERLVQLREENGIAQIELAERLHVTRQAVSRWEGGKTEPDVDTLIAIAKIFGVSLDYLCGADEVLRPERKEELPEKEKRKKSVRVIAGIAVLAVLVMIGLTALFTVGSTGAAFASRSGCVLLWEQAGAENRKHRTDL